MPDPPPLALPLPPHCHAPALARTPGHCCHCHPPTGVAWQCSVAVEAGGEWILTSVVTVICI